MDGYLDAVDPAQFAHVQLGGVTVRVERARLGLHLKLARIAERFDAEPNAGAVREYLEVCGLVAEGTGVELLYAYTRLRFLNDWQWELPWMLEPKAPRKPPAYEYAGRTWAWWVHKMASRYGWTRDEVFDLWPEEAACYLQEIFVAEFDETDARRSLSELAYRYDKTSREARFIPTPRPGWMAGREPPKKRPVRKDMLPVGNVIDAETLH